MRYYIIAGEKSGDMHGGRLIQALKQEDPQAVFRCWGGGCMQRAGGSLVVHYRELALMGLAFLPKLWRLLGYLRYCQQDLLGFRPDVVVLVDYAGFNLRIARFAREHGIRTFYYISPKVWAWHRGRVREIKASVDRMFSIFPFERDFYKGYGYAVDYVGNPLVEEVGLHRVNLNFLLTHGLDQRPIIALLPGSRIQEVKRMLRAMLAVVPALGAYQFVVAATKDVPQELYAMADEIRGVCVVYDQTYDVLAHAHAAVVAAGTASLEAALFRVPQVVVYKTDVLTYGLAKWLVRLRHISLVNIIAGREVVRELIQGDFNTSALSQALARLVEDKAYRELQLAGYATVRQRLGEGYASARVAKLMVDYLGLE